MNTFRTSIARSAARTAFVKTSSRPFTARAPLLAQSDYGSPEGDPKAADPQAQGKNPKVDQEHPGPPPPSSAQGGSSGGSSGSSSGSQPAPSRFKNGAQPKIHNEPQPKNDSPDVKKHNEEVAKRSGKQADKDGEKVDPKFWKGHAEDKAE